MTVNKFATDYVVEIQNGASSDGISCCERVFVKVHDDGCEVYLAIKTDNLEPTDEFDPHTITISRKDLAGLTLALEAIFGEHGTA